jgi:F-type H+-transporting ATPase subunit b
MRFTTRVVGWCAAVLVVVALSATRPCLAQEGGVEADAKAAAEEAAHESAGGEHGGGDPNPLAIDPDLAIWTLVVFVLLFSILYKFAWPQIAAAVDERERKIAETIAAAQRLQEDAKRLLGEHEAKLAAAAGDVRALLEEARRDAEHTKASIVADAKKAAEAEVERARRDIERAKEGAIQELAVKSANVAIELAGHVVGAQLTAEQNNKLVRDAMTKLAAAAPSKN